MKVTVKAFTTEKHRIQKRLDEELERLKRTMGLDQGLKVVWKPDANKALSGEVQGQEIFIYEADEDKALNVLRHEFIDSMVSQAIEPYRKITNSLIKLANEGACRTKEQAVNALERLLGDGSG